MNPLTQRAPAPPPVRNFWSDIIELMRNYDGDSLWLRVELSYRVQVVIDYRLALIDTPEQGNPGADEATNYLSQRIKQGLLEKKHLQVYSTRTSKYGDWVAHIFIGQEYLNITMLDLGLGVPYDGGRKPSS